MAFTAGTKIGPYEVAGLLGTGGMGEVYRARDTRLKRDVALKILPAEVSADPERVSRFQREAEVLASLNHPNIASIHDLQRIDETSFLVLELVEGDTLAERIARGTVPMEEALDISMQIATALEAAHAKGIVHRDLKPANVKITPEGKVKVLDFGLARVFGAETKPSSFSQSPTLLSGTLGGVILGTAPYMSPEQARGQTATEQSDIWAFGVVFYEMLTGKPAFSGETLTDVLGGIVRTEPDWGALPHDTPSLVRLLLRHCLQKNRTARLHHIADARIQIDAVLNSPSVEPPTAQPATASRQSIFWMALAIVLPLAVAAAAAPFMVRYYRFASRDVGSVRFSVTAPENAIFGRGGTAPYIALSPDGRKLAFIADLDRVSRVWIRTLDSVEPRPLAGTEGVSTAASPAPFWSPDSRFLAYFAQGRLKRIDVTGGPPLTICEAEGSSGTWNQNDVIVFDAGGTGGGLRRVAAAGGKPEPVTVLDEYRQERSHLYPHFLPDGDHFLFLARTASAEGNAIMAGSLSSKEVKTVTNADSRVAFDPSGHLLFVREQSLLALPFDASTQQAEGDPVPVAEAVRYNATTGAAAFSLSQNGVLAFRSTAASVARVNDRLTWFDRQGKVLDTFGDPGLYENLELSPDGKRVALEKRDSQGPNTDIVIMDTTRGVSTRLTFDTAPDLYAVWSPSGDQIIFASGQKQSGVYRKAASGAGTEELILKPPYAAVWDWSRDGKYLIYGRDIREISALSLSGNGGPVTYLPPSNFTKLQAQLSPDGNWLAYSSNESGGLEVYIQSFPVPSGKWRISTDGGTSARWRNDGRELFYISTNRKLTAVAIRSNNNSIEVGTPESLFDVPPGAGIFAGTLAAGALRRAQYDIAPDGRFLFNVRVDEEADTPVTVITNWTAGLKR